MKFFCPTLSTCILNKYHLGIFKSQDICQPCQSSSYHYRIVRALTRSISTHQINPILYIPTYSTPNPTILYTNNPVPSAATNNIFGHWVPTLNLYKRARRRNSSSLMLPPFQVTAHQHLLSLRMPSSSSSSTCRTKAARLVQGLPT